MAETRLMKIMLALAVTVAMLLVSSGMESASSKPVVVLLESGPEADALTKVAEAYQNSTGKKVELQIVGRQVRMQLTTQVLMSGSSDIDLLYSGSYDVAGYAAAGLLEPIDRFLDDPKFTPPDFDFADIARKYKYGGKTYAIPFDTGALFLFYRKDLIPEPPQTWEEFTAVARRFTKSLNPASPTTYGIGYYGHVRRAGSRVWSPILWSYGGDIVDESGSIDLGVR